MARKWKKKKEDLGLGSKLISDIRFINKNGKFNVKRTGPRVRTPYLDLIEMAPLRFFSVIIGSFILINVLFALLFLVGGTGTLSGTPPDASLFIRFLYAFFFSVQTFTTVGYGGISPGSLYGNIIAAIDALIGLLSLAMATGLFFARFSKSKAHIIYSQNMLISPFGEESALMFRVANLRSNKIINLQAAVTATYIEKVDGIDKRKYANLSLEIERIALFALGWTVVHPLNEKSPFFGKTKEDLNRMKVEFITQLEGHDETYERMIHSHYSYLSSEIKWGYRFLPMFETKNGQIVLNLKDIGKKEKIEI